MKNMKDIISVIVFGLLILISVVQALQLNEMKSKLSNANIGSASTPIAASSSGGASLPSNIQNLPSMVGGC